MGQAPAFQRALEQLHALLLRRKVFECHRGCYSGSAEGMRETSERKRET